MLDKTFDVHFRADRTRAGLSIGDDCILRNQCIFESSEGFIDIGNRVFINTGTQLISRSRIDIGDDVTIAWNCVVYDHDSHSLDHEERIRDHRRQLADWDSGDFIRNKDWTHVETAPIKIGNFVWIGFDVVILKGVTIGEGAVIGARSVVASDVSPWTVVAGNPARAIKQLRPSCPVGSTGA